MVDHIDIGGRGRPSRKVGRSSDLRSVFFLKPVQLCVRREHHLWPIGRSEEVWITQTADLIYGEMVRLGTKWEFHDPHGQLGDQAGGDDGAGATARIVAIKHESDLSEVLLEKHLLPAREGTSH